MSWKGKYEILGILTFEDLIFQVRSLLRTYTNTMNKTTGMIRIGGLDEKFKLAVT